jgi:hypothetical protein
MKFTDSVTTTVPRWPQDVGRASVDKPPAGGANRRQSVFRQELDDLERLLNEFEQSISKEDN